MTPQSKNHSYAYLTGKALSRYFKHCRIPKATGRSCIIAGNGPSLADNLKKDRDILQSTPVFCVNHFVNSSEFTIIKPKYYCMIDPSFFRTTLSAEREKGRNKTLQNLNDLTTWDMHLFLPFLPGQIMLEAYLPSPHLHMHICHIYPGFNWPVLRNLIYRTGLLMPTPQNVLVAAIFQAINMGYKEICLLGAEHSWIEDLRVKEDNLLYTVQKHFSGETDEIPMYKAAPRNTETFKVHEMLEAFRRTFKSYWLLKEYAAYRGATVFNSTPCSSIDAFERRNISTLH